MQLSLHRGVISHRHAPVPAAVPRRTVPRRNHASGGTATCPLFPPLQRLHHLLECRRARQLVPPVNITNTSTEIYKAEGLDPDTVDDDIVLDPNYQVHNPELGPLSKRVKRFYLDGLLSNEVDYEETAYWFTTPPEGWSSKEERLEQAEEAPVTFPEPYHEKAELENRILFEDLEEGQVYDGIVSDIWLYHGAQIDIGAEFDGLIVISEEEWLEGGKPSPTEMAALEEATLLEAHEARMDAVLEALYRVPPERIEEATAASARLLEVAEAEDMEALERVSSGGLTGEVTVVRPEKLPAVEVQTAEPLDTESLYELLDKVLDPESAALVREVSEAAFWDAVEARKPLTVIESFLPGDKVQVRVHKLRMPGLYRWPVQLSIVREEVADMISDPDEYDPPVDHGWAADNGWSMEDILQATGRTYDVVSYFLPRDEDDDSADLQRAYGWESEDTGHYDHNPLEKSWLEDNQALIHGTASGVM